MLRVAIVAPSPLVRADLRRIVADVQDFAPAGEVGTLSALRAALVRTPALRVDIAIVDGGPAASGNVDRWDPLLECLDAGLPLVLLSDADAAYLLPFVAAGGTWLATAATAAQIEAAVRASAAGLVALQPERLDQVRDALRRMARGDERRAIELLEPLTPRELQVLERLAAGRGNRLIASDLGISEHTAKFHVSRVLGKLAAATRAEAVAIGLRSGLIGAK